MAAPSFSRLAGGSKHAVQRVHAVLRGRTAGRVLWSGPPRVDGPRPSWTTGLCHLGPVDERQAWCSSRRRRPCGSLEPRARPIQFKQLFCHVRNSAISGAATLWDARRPGGDEARFTSW